MRYLLLAVIFMISVTGPAFASEKDLALSAAVSMDEAIKTATASVPGGKPYEVEVTSKKGQTVYKVEIVDQSKKTHKIFVDAQTGKLIVEQ